MYMNLLKSLLFLFLFFVSTIIFSQSLTKTQFTYKNNKAIGKYEKVNDIKMYYEVYGKGKPLILIHGNGASIKSMKYQIEYFSKYYKVIVADSRGHGKSEAGKNKLTYRQMANDWARLLTKLKIDSAYILGWSDGGIIGLLLAINYPAKVKMLAAMGANLLPDSSAVYKWAINWVHKNQVITNKMIAQKDTTQNWKLLKQQLNLLAAQPHISLNELHKISAPVLILSGDKDVIKIEHTILIYQNISKAQLCIFPGATHMIPEINPKLFNDTVYNFFNKPFSRPDTKDYF